MYRRIVVLTGAGISAAPGIATLRDHGPATQVPPAYVDRLLSTGD